MPAWPRNCSKCSSCRAQPSGLPALKPRGCMPAIPCATPVAHASSPSRSSEAPCQQVHLVEDAGRGCCHARAGHGPGDGIEDYSDVRSLVSQVGDEVLREVLANAEAGQFNALQGLLALPSEVGQHGPSSSSAGARSRAKRSPLQPSLFPVIPAVPVHEAPDAVAHAGTRYESGPRGQCVGVGISRGNVPIL